MEVLIATFILSIGLVAIMALFPIGAVNMARAITQDRSATHGVNSDTMFRYYWKQAWNDPTSGTTRASAGEAYAYSQEPVVWLLQNHPSYGTIPNTSSQPSFPVLVDPVGFLTNGGSGNNQYFVAGGASLPVRTTLRRCINYPNQAPGYTTGPNDAAWPAPFTAGGPTAYPPMPFQSSVVRLTTLLDELTFSKPNDGSQYAVNGEPSDSTFAIDRGGRYSAAWLVQLPRCDVPAEANVTVLVYAGRSPTDTPSAETTYPIVGGGGKTIVLNIGNQASPNLRRGSWIGVAQLVVATPAGSPVVPYPTLDFYRVVGMNTDTPGAAILELETALKNVGVTQGTPSAVVFENLVEVFDRGTVSATGVTVP
jgi:hypothetical protein